MVKIVKGDSHLMVPRGAFHNYYESQGYRLSEASEALDKDPGMFTGEEGHSPDQESPAVSDGYTKDQIMAMTTDQLYEVADKLGINYQRVRTKPDLVKLIIQTL